MHEMELRAAATRATWKRFAGREWAWGSVDCIKLARHQAVKMGHKGLPRSPRYSTALGAKRALGKMGFETVEGLLEAHFPRIAPAAARVGDLIIGDGAEGLDAVFVSGGRKMMGFHVDAAELVWIIPEQVRGAFRL